MGRPEILAPAGSREALTAAVRCGANAVYLGGKSLSARQNARNFDPDELKEAVDYCHLRDVKVYLTLNTLVTDSQQPLLKQAAQEALAAGVDAVLVQDLGVLRFLRDCCPDLPLHASTQMVVHNLPSAKAAVDLGCSRVVLARECSREEIKNITDHCGAETEVFVHGALCMSLSGQCYLSSMIGRRSGNRGLCAQPCRLPFAGSQREYSLSLKDMSLVEQLPDLAGLGVASFKIEGRMKRPEYVAAAVTACRNALEGRPVDFDKLMAVFSRSGFTQNYYLGKPSVDMFGIRQKEDVTAATNKLLSGFEGLYRNEMPLVPVDMTLKLAEGQPAMLQLTDDRGNKAAREGEVPQTAINRPTDEALARRSLEKTGGTPYYLRNLNCSIDEGLMMPVSALNGLRSAALEKLNALRSSQRNEYTFLPEECFVPEQKAGSAPVEPALRIRLQKADRFSPEMVKQAQMIILPWQELAKVERWERYPEKFAAEVPNMLFDGQWPKMMEGMNALKEKGLRHAAVANLGAIQPLKQLGLTLHGTFNLNLTNSTAVAEYARLGLADSELSIELAMHQAKTVVRGMPLGLVAYGYLPLMYTRSCPIRGAKGCGSCTGRGVLTDRMGNRFTVDCVDRRHSRLLNMVPLSLSDRMADLRGLDFATLYFTHETAEECLQVLQAFRSGQGTSGKRTGGLYYREEL